MTSVNFFSDSQESLKSMLLDEAEFKVLQENVGQLDGMHDFLDNNVLDEEKMLYLQPQQLIATPAYDEFPGEYNFQMILNNHVTDKHCVYSHMLQKMFINMEQTLPLKFEWSPPVDGLYVRTTMVFALEQYRCDPVIRCHNHMATQSPANMAVSPPVLRHVARCLHQLSLYDEMGGHMSVLAPLGRPQAGSNYVPLSFRFYCKNSCTSGMNRRPTELVFTLENSNGVVLGRRRLAVRVCSCPKRDKIKEESEHQTGKVLTANGKKRKKISTPGKKPFVCVSDPGDSREHYVHLKLPGKDNCEAVVKYAYDLLAGQAARTGQHELIRPYMEDLAMKMQYMQ